MEEEKTPKQNPATSFNRLLSVAKKLKKTWHGQVKIIKIYFIGDMTKGKYGKGYYGNFIMKRINLIQMRVKIVCYYWK